MEVLALGQGSELLEAGTRVNRRQGLGTSRQRASPWQRSEAIIGQISRKAIERVTTLAEDSEASPHVRTGES